MTAKQNMEIFLAFWERLSTVKQLNLNARTRFSNEKGWNQKGLGNVQVSKEGSSVLIFQEKGTWQGGEEQTGFTNMFRWTFDRNAGMITLERIRWGGENTSFLFHLAPSENYSLSSVDSHLCGGDIYFGQIYFDRHSLRLTWRIIGPKKNEEIDYFYT
jgi:hypothetical protein